MEADMLCCGYTLLYTEEEAMSINNDSLTYVDTIKIEWEE